MTDDRMKQIEQDNAEDMYWMLAPFRMIRGFLQVVLLIVGLILVLIYDQVGWIVNVGPRSMSDRAAVTDSIEKHLKPYDGDSVADADGEDWFTFQVDFRSLPNIDSTHIDPNDQFHIQPVHDYILTQFNEKPPTGIKPFRTKELSGGPLGLGVPYCVPPNVTFFDTTPGGWWDRGRVALDRKAARMRRDYEAAAQMSAALRATIVTLKLHRPISSIRTVSDKNTGTDPNQTFCNAVVDPHDRAYLETSKQVVLRHAPVIQIRYIHFDLIDGNGAPDLLENRMEVFGICLADHCKEGLRYNATYAADLFATNPPLSDEQLAAEKAMLAMTTREFWEEAARENHVTDYDAVDEMRRSALLDLQITVQDIHFAE